MFHNEEVGIHVIRPTRGRAVVTELLGQHRPDIWVSELLLELYSLAHQLRDLRS